MQSIEDQNERYKAQVRREWTQDETAAAWRKHYPHMTSSLAEVTKAIVEAANPQPGMRILDLASGTGEPALTLARRVKPGGVVVATDLSAAMLQVLRDNARDQGIENLETSIEDAHQLNFPDESFEAVTSRFGCMFFVEIDKALTEIRRVLKPGGQVTFLCWGPPSPGTYFGTCVVPFVKRLAEKPDPDSPGPMRYAEPGKLKALVEQAGFTHVTEAIGSHTVLWEGSPEQILRALMEIAAPFRAAAESLSPSDRHDAEQEAYANLRPLYDGKVTTVQAPTVIVTGRK